MSAEGFEALWEILAQLIYESEMKKWQAQVRGKVATVSHDVGPTRNESTFLLNLS